MRCVVIGGGIGGLTSALALKRIGVHVTLLEAKSTVSCHEGLYTGLWDPVFRIFRKLELYSELEEHIQPVKRSGFKDISGNFMIEPRQGLKIPPEHPSLGFVNQNLLINKLYEKVQENVRLNSPVSRIYRNRTEAVIEVENQETIFADFVIAADGLNSIGKRTALGIDNIPRISRGYRVFRGHTSASRSIVNDFEAFQTWGVGCRFAAVPTRNGIAWYAAVTDSVLSKSLERTHAHTVDVLGHIYAGWHEPIGFLLSNVDGGVGGIIEDEIYESKLKYQGWDAILKFENGVTVPSENDPLTIRSASIEDLLKKEEIDETESSPEKKKLSYREALASGMWRVRTAPLLFYIGDSAYMMDPILAQGAGLAIEGAYGLANTFKDSNILQNIPTQDDTTGVDMDHIMPHLMDYENQRYFRYLRLGRMSKIVDLFGNTSSQAVYQTRNTLLNLTPKVIKGSAFDYMIEKSLYY